MTRGWNGMASQIPETELHDRFSSPGASATPWDEGAKRLAEAEIYWVTTVRTDGRPHVTPLVAVWLDDALFFCTGEEERKARNLERNPHCVMTTGCNRFREGFDLVVEGDAVRISAEAQLQRVADAIAAKYDWHYEVGDGALREVRGPEPDVDTDRGRSIVFRLAPTRIFGYGRDETFSATRWSF
jgi:PPOX class probable F420-dependent enzyme